MQRNKEWLDVKPMKNVLRKLVKFLLVGLQPVNALLFILFVYTNNTLWIGITAIVLVTFAFASSVFCYAMLDNIKVLPTVKIEYQPVIGLSLGLSEGAVIIILPFCIIEILYKK